MQALIRHLVNNNLPEITKDSLFNCHCKGLHSLMLINKPEQRVRLFVAVPGNELWKNQIDAFHSSAEMSVAIHPHHCNVTLQVVKGKLFNDAYVVSKTDNAKMWDKYLYHSGVANGAASFEYLGAQGLELQEITSLSIDQSIYLEAAEMHTVYCAKDKVTAWFVFEGLEDPNYKPICYSNRDLTAFDSSELYKPLEEVQVIRLLSAAGLY